MDAPTLIERWRRTLGLRGWKIRHRDEDPPEPARIVAFNEHDFLAKEAVLWAKTEGDIIHEELHLLLAPLEDAFWKTEHDKALRTLWTRREEQVVLRLERAFLKVLKSK